MARSDIESHRCWPLAVHEAAHAVLGVLFGLRLQRLEIDLRAWQGRTTFEAGFPPGKWRQDLLVSLAGEIAQKRADPGGWSLSNGVGSARAAEDLKQARAAVGRFHHPPGVDDEGRIEDEERLARLRMAEGERISASLVNRLWPTIAALAERLLDEKGLLESDAIEHFLERAFPVETRGAIAGDCEFANRGP